MTAARPVVDERSLRPAVFFDRDGVLNIDNGFTHRPDDLRWNEGAVAAIKAVNDAGWYAFVVTNQAGVAHGHYTEKEVDDFHRQMDRVLAEHGAHIDEYVYCPFHPEAKLAAYRRDSPHRKPQPGMILDLVARWPVEIQKSFLVGTGKDLRPPRLRSGPISMRAGTCFSGEARSGGFGCRRLKAVVPDRAGRSICSQGSPAGLIFD